MIMLQSICYYHYSLCHSLQRFVFYWASDKPQRSQRFLSALRVKTLWSPWLKKKRCI